MAFFPHVLLQDSLGFFEMSGRSIGRQLRWNYRQGKTFQVEGDRGSIQRLLLLCLQEYIELTENIDLTIGTVVHKRAPFSPALSFEPRQESFEALERALTTDQNTRQFFQNSKIAFYENQILFPISQIVFDDFLAPIDMLDLRKKYDSVEDAKLLLSLFFSSTSDRIDALQKSVHEGSWNEAFRLAHSIKGGALSISAHEIAGIAKEIELKIKSSSHFNFEIAIESLRKSFLKGRSYWEKLKQKELQ
ncbi:MAG: Hpt domain-containing protein [Spirochaetales bacterium]|nr:Hpt domain-containing protein [Spirochaetales bacterium]